jgi:hypothetical protein
MLAKVGYGRIPDPRRVKEPAGLSDRELIMFWLSDANARRELPDQPAGICRRLIDLETLDLEPQKDGWPWPVKFCFICGTPTKPHGEPFYESPNLCERGHLLWDRGGHIHLPAPNHEVELYFEPYQWWAASQADYWLKDSDNTTPYLSPAMRSAMRRMRPALGSGKPPE